MKHDLIIILYILQLYHSSNELHNSYSLYIPYSQTLYEQSTDGTWLGSCAYVQYLTCYGCQVAYLWVLPRFLREEKVSTIMILVQLIFLFQYIPKVWHGYILMYRMRLVNGYIFGSIWFRVGLSFMAYYLGFHVCLFIFFP